GLAEHLEGKKNWKRDASLCGDLLNEAVEEGHWGVVEVLLDRRLSASAAFERALGRKRLALAGRVLGRGVSQKALQGCLARWDEHFWKDLDLVRRLIDAGADINHRDDFGSTPLHHAVWSRQAAGVRLLLERGADPTVKNDDGLLPE